MSPHGKFDMLAGLELVQTELHEQSGEWGKTSYILGSVWKSMAGVGHKLYGEVEKKLCRRKLFVKKSFIADREEFCLPENGIKFRACN